MSSPKQPSSRKSAAGALGSSFVAMERGEITWLTLNRPTAQNAVNPLLVHQLKEAVQSSLDDPGVRGVVIRGAGKSFCVGADLNFFQRNVASGDLEAIYKFSAACHELINRVATASKPIVACVRGSALGAGLELALACRAIIVSRSCALGLPETGLGICPGAGGMQLTTRRIGIPLAKWMIYTGHLLSAPAAEAIGLVNQVAQESDLETLAASLAGGAANMRAPRAALSDDYAAYAELFSRFTVEELLGMCGQPEDSLQLDRRALRVLKRLATRSRYGLRLAERLIDHGAALPLAEALQFELLEQRAMWTTEDVRLGMASVGGPPPKFVGR